MGPLRSAIYALVFYPATAVFIAGCFIASLFGGEQMRSVVHAWTNFHHRFVRLLGTRVAVEGEIPAGAYLIAVKHQSMFETLEMMRIARTPVVVMKPTDLAAIQKLPDVAAQLLRQAGFKVDLQAMDWQTLVGRRAKKDAPDKGGWHMFLTAWQTYDVWSPIANPTMDTRGEKSGWFGWASDDKIMELRAQFMRATDEPTKKKLADQIHARAFEVATHAPLGEYDQPMAARKNITGFFVTNGNIYWNLKKNGS